MRRMAYESDAEYDGRYFKYKRVKGVAWRVIGWETEPDEDTEWTDIEVRTGKLLARMVGDDTYHRVDPEDLEPLDESAFCGTCGQIGCGQG